MPTARSAKPWRAPRNSVWELTCTVTLDAFALACCEVSEKLELALSMLATVPVSAPAPLELHAVRAPPSRNSSAHRAAIICLCASVSSGLDIGNLFLPGVVDRNQAREAISKQARCARITNLPGLSRSKLQRLWRFLGASGGRS